MPNQAMTKEILKAIRATADAASDYPWRNDQFKIIDNCGYRVANVMITMQEQNADGNAAFIASSRETMPRLLDALEAGIKALEGCGHNPLKPKGAFPTDAEIFYDRAERVKTAQEALAAIDRILSGEK